MDVIKKLWKEFDSRYEDTGLARGAFAAPGRVNLIGEHTDYNDGFVLPMAIEKDIKMVAQLRDDRTVQAYDLNYEPAVSFSLDLLEPVEDNKWVNYLMGVAREIEELGYEMQGMNIVLAGNIPKSSGLSSSAALEVVTAYTFASLNNLDIQPVEMALLCQRAENNFVGVNCGIMDQYISRLGKEGYALMIDCRSTEYELIPFSSEKYKIVICNSNVERDLVDSEYNKRREECNRATRFFDKELKHKVQALRDVKPEDFNEFADKLPQITRKRARHIISENKRVLESMGALKNNDFETFGDLMLESHESLRDDYQVSCEELDILVELAMEQDGVLGARMTGAGFGGCTVNLVSENSAEEFVKNIKELYKEKTGIETDLYISSPAQGARKINN
ncbi:MAG: galactokinase [Halanaerobiaceae bacterium]